MSRIALLAAALAALSCAGAHAQASCSSDDQPQPSALVERFINADCEKCWSDPATARPGPGELALDWIVPGSKGDDAPLSAAANRDARERLQAMRRQRPAEAETVRGARESDIGTLRVAHGPAFNGYIGTSIELKDARPGAWSAWLALVETIPAGTEGSPVERNLVRNVLQVPWPPGSPRLRDSRPMGIPQGANPERLRVVGWVEDARGGIRAIAESVCAIPKWKR
jgi:hypothetical protein